MLKWLEGGVWAAGAAVLTQIVQGHFPHGSADYVADATLAFTTFVAYLRTSPLPAGVTLPTAK